MSEPVSIKDEFPLIPKHLLDRLDEAFPNRLPKNRDATERDIWIAMGSVRVVDFLKDIYEQQREREEN